MNVLIVTNQLIKEENERFYCIENVYDILKRFSFLGTLMICAKKYSGRTSNIIDTGFSIALEKIKYISSTYLVLSRQDKKFFSTMKSSIWVMLFIEFHIIKL